MLDIKQIGKCAYDALVDTVVNHDGVEHAGYIAFLSLLAIFPFLVFFFALAGFIGQTELGEQLIGLILTNNLLPADVIHALEPRVQEIASGPPQGLLTVAIIGAIWTSSSAVEGIRTILNRAYRVSTPPAYIFRRLLSIAQFLILTAIIIFFTFLLIITPNLWQSLKESLQLSELKIFLNEHGIYISPYWQYLRYIITAFVLLLVVSTCYIVLPNIKQNWKSVMPGAFLVVFLWFIAGITFSNYLSNFDQVNIIYGSLGGVIAALLFFYITAMIFIYGAEFNYMIETALGNKIQEKEAD